MKCTPLSRWMPRRFPALVATLNACWRRMIAPGPGSRVFLSGAVALAGLAAPAPAGTTWDGGGADDNWGTPGNWNPDGPPPVGATVDLTFDGSTRLNPFNNYTAFDDFHSITFAATASAFNIGGNAIDIFGKIENYSTVTQTISLAALAINGGQSGTGEFNPVNGDLVINSANVFTNGNNVRVFGVNNRTVTFGAGTNISQGGGVVVEQASNVVLLGANTYTGGTTVNAGTLTVGNGTNAGSIAGASAVTIAGGAQMKWDNSNSSGSSVTIANNLSGAGTVLFQGTNNAANAIFSNYTLTGNNSGFNGTLRVNGARIIANSASQLSAAAIDLQTGASALLTGTNTLANNFTIGNGAGWRDSGFYVGALRLEGNQTLNGNITLNNTTGIVLGDGTGQYSSIGGYSAGTHALNGVISGGGDLAMSRFTSWNGGTTQPVNITLGGASSNTYTGKTVVDGQGANASLLLQKTGGAVAIAANTQVWFGSGTGGQFNLRMGDVTTTGAARNQWDNQFGTGVVIVGKNSAGNWGRFDLQGTNQTLAGLDGGTANANFVVQNQSLTNFDPGQNATLTLNGTGTYAAYGYFRDQDNGGTTRKLNILKTGAGTQTIGNQAAASISYTGTTTVNQGILAHDTTLAGTSSWNSPVTVNAGGEFRTSGTNNNQGAAGGTLTLNGGNYSHTTTAANAWKVWTGGLTVSAASTVNVNNTNTTNNNVFFDAGISGAGALTLNTTGGGNNGIVFRTTPGSYSGALGVNSGNVFVNGTAGLVFQNSNVTLASGSSLRLDANWAGSVANASVKSLNGAGAVTLGAQTLTLGTNDGSGTFTGGISGTGAVVKSGIGSQSLGTANPAGSGVAYTGATTVNGGTLSLVDARLVAGAKTVAGGATLEINSSIPFLTRWNNSGTISGAGIINKTGTGVFGTTGAVNFSGTLNILDGRIHNDNVTGNWTGSTVDVNISAPGVLDLRANDIHVDELNGTGAIWNSHPAGGGDVLFVGVANGSSSYGGVINGNATQAADNPNGAVLSLTKQGTGTFTMTGGANVYSGPTTVNNGVLKISGGNDRLPTGTALTVNGGATFGGTFDLNALNQTVATLSGGSGAVTGKVTNTASGTGILTVTGTSTFDGVIQDGGAGMLTGLTKSGTGTLSLTGNNTQSGPTLITGGALRQSSATALSPNSNVNMNGGIVELGVTDFTAALGTGNGQVQFSGNGGFGAFGGTRIVNIGGAGGTMTWNAGNFVPTGSSLILSGPNSDSTTRFLNPIDLNAGAGRITSLGGSAAIDAELAGDISNGALTLAPVNSQFQITGQVSGSTVVENGATGTNNMQVLLQRGGGNAINGAFQIGVPAAAGTFTTVRLGAADQIADSTVVTFGASAGSWSYLNLYGFNETIAGLSNLGGADGGVLQLVEGDASPATNSTLTLNVAAGTQSYTGHIRDRSTGFSNHATAGKLNFIKTGAGTQELTTWNNQTWGGTTAVQQGTLKLILNNGANLPGALSVDGGATLEFAPAGANNYNLSGAVTGAGNVVKSGTGTASLLNTTVNLTGEIQILDGRLRNDGNFTNWSASTANLDIAAAGILDLYADAVYVNKLTGTGFVQNNYGNGGGQSGASPFIEKLVVGVANGSSTFDGVIRDNSTNTAPAAGTAGGGVQLEKTGSGTQILTGTNIYTGITTISGGVLQIGNGGATGTLGSGAVTNDASLVFDRSDDHTVANNITGTGSLTQQGDGILTLSGTNNLGGVVTAASGTLSVTGTTVFGSLNVGNGGTLAGNGNLNSGGGSVTIAAGGKLSPGTSPGVLIVDLGGGTFDISPAVAAGGSASMNFELGAPNSDGVLLTNTFLNIGAGTLEFDDFNFTAGTGFTLGTYTLFDGDSTISGTLGASLSGGVGGYLSTLSLANGNQDLILTVVPEPGSAVLLLSGSLLLMRRRRSRSV